MESILDKIKKLINKQESAEAIGSTEEAEAFACKIQELLNKHNLDKSEIKMDDDPTRDTLVNDRSLHVKIKGIGGMSGHNLMSAICDYNWCACYWVGRLSDNNYMRIIGTSENIEICKYLYSYLENFVKQDGKPKYEIYKNAQIFNRPVGFDTYMRNYVKGFAQGLRIKFGREQDKFLLNYENSTALVRTNEVALKEFAGKIKTVKKAGISLGDAYLEGKKSGETVQINKGIATTKPIERKMLN